VAGPGLDSSGAAGKRGRDRRCSGTSFAKLVELSDIRGDLHMHTTGKRWAGDAGGDGGGGAGAGLD